MCRKIVKTKNIKHKTHLKIVSYLNQSGQIIGSKIINDKSSAPVIEFSDNSRIWMLPEELEYIFNTKKY